MRSALVAVAACLLAPATAAASTAKVISVYESRGTAYKVEYRAAPGEVNDLSVTPGPASLVVTDPGAEIEPGDGCAPAGDHSVACAHPEGLGLVAWLGNEGDRFVGEGSGDVHGGAGNDDLTGGWFMFGDGGDDVLTAAGERGTWFWGGDGADTLTGGDSDDFFVGGLGPDTIDGRGESGLYGTADRASYEDHDERVVVDLSKPGSPAGSEGEGDALAGIESVTGGHGPDQLTARKGVSSSELGSTMSGLRGDDLIRGGPGRDGIGGGSGDDSLRGGGGDDSLDGGPGRDTLSGGGGSNTISSYEHRRQTRDSVRCGDGGSVIALAVSIPLLDVIDQSCGSVKYWSVPVDRVEFDYSGLSEGVLGVDIGCDRRCRVRIALRAQDRPAGSARRTIRAGRRARFEIPLSAAARDALARRGVLRLRFAMDIAFDPELRYYESTHWFLMLHRPAGGR